jgi:NADH-quinone oxidoreductase subunit E
VELEKKVEELILSINPEEGLISMLQKTQEAFGYIPKYSIEKMSETFAIPVADIYGVITFYAQFRLKPRGKHIVKLCRGTACHVAGSAQLEKDMRKILKLKDTDDTSADSLFTVESVACLGCCSLAPVMMVDKEVYGKLQSKKLEEILKHGK